MIDGAHFCDGTYDGHFQRCKFAMDDVLLIGYINEQRKRRTHFRTFNDRFFMNDGDRFGF